MRDDRNKSNYTAPNLYVRLADVVKERKKFEQSRDQRNWRTSSPMGIIHVFCNRVAFDLRRSPFLLCARIPFRTLTFFGPALIHADQIKCFEIGEKCLTFLNTVFRSFAVVPNS